MNKVWESFLNLINETGGVYDNFATLLIKEAINALWEMIIRKHQIIDGDWMLLYVASDHKKSPICGKRRWLSDHDDYDDE